MLLGHNSRIRCHAASSDCDRSSPSGTFPEGADQSTTTPLQPHLTKGVFGYRTLKDLDDIIEYSKDHKRCVVLGGGLLGLEAAKAAYDLGCEVHVVEFAPRLMPRQVDDQGSKLLVSKIEALGLKVRSLPGFGFHPSKCMRRLQGRIRRFISGLQLSTTSSTTPAPFAASSSRAKTSWTLT